MFCEKCGKRLEDSSTFCPYCGYKADLPQSVIGTAEPVYMQEDLSRVNVGTPFGAEKAYQPTENAFSVEYPSAGKVIRMNENLRPVQGVPDSGKAADRPSAKKKGGAKTAIIAVVVAVLVIAIAFGAFWFITDGKLFKSDIFNKDGTGETEQVETTTSVYVPSEIFSPDTSSADKEYYVNIATVTVYKGPDTSAYRAVCNVSKDEVLIAKGSHSDYPEWLYVYSAKNNKYGWVSAALLSEKNSSEAETTDVNTNTEVVYYDAASRFDIMINVGEGHSLNLRRQPDTTDPNNIILQIPDKANVLVLGVSGKNAKWYYVEYTDEFGTYYGYVHSDHTQRYY